MLVVLARLLGLGIISIRRVRFRSGSSVPQIDFFRHFSEGHHGFLEGIRVTIVDKLIAGDRIRESFWQHRLDTFTPQSLNVREVDT